MRCVLKEFTDLSALEQLESSCEINAIGWIWFELAQKTGLSDDPTKEIQAMLDKIGWTTYPSMVISQTTSTGCDCSS